MFEETKEMIDSTIYTNGRGEVTAQSVNLAMHGILDAAEGKFTEVNDAVKAVEDKVTALEENVTGGGAGALKVWMLVEDASTELTPEQIAENVATYNEIVKGEPVSVVICMAERADGITAVGTLPTTASYTDYGGNKTVALLANQFVHGDITAILGQLFSDGSVVITTETFDVPSSSGSLRVWINEGGAILDDDKISENVATYNSIAEGTAGSVVFIAEYREDDGSVYRASYAVSVYESYPGGVSLGHGSRIYTGDGVEDVFINVVLYPDGTTEITA